MQNCFLAMQTLSFPIKNHSNGFMIMIMSNFKLLFLFSSHVDRFCHGLPCSLVIKSNLCFFQEEYHVFPVYGIEFACIAFFCEYTLKQNMANSISGKFQA